VNLLETVYLQTVSNPYQLHDIYRAWAQATAAVVYTLPTVLLLPVPVIWDSGVVAATGLNLDCQTRPIVLPI
jgi:hypothetical protein